MNKRRRNRCSIAILSVIGALSCQLPGIACGPFFDMADFAFTKHPDFPLSKFTAGNIGVLKKSMARSFLLVAWRNLSGLPLSAAEQKSILALWEQRLGNGAVDDGPALRNWIDLVNKQKNLKGQKSEPYQEKSYAGNGAYFNFINCPGQAFAFATKTAQDLSSKFGADSNELSDWMKAQNAVFCNCGGFDNKATIPEPLAGSLDSKLKAYRDYQIASANFYAGNYDTAKTQFEAISNDASSPFKDLSSYLALRAEVRKATVADKTDDNLLASVEKQVRTLLNDKSKSSVHAAAEDLLAYIRFKIDKTARFAELTNALSSSAEGAQAGDHLCDYTFLFDNLLGETDDPVNSIALNKAKPIQDAGELSDWLLTFQEKFPGAAKHALAQWQSTHKLPWLLAALTTIDAKDGESSKLIAEARHVAKTSPAYAHLQFEIALKLSATGKTDEARKTLETVLTDKTIELSPSARNNYIQERMAIARDFADFMHFALQHPVSVDEGAGDLEIPIDYDKIKDAKSFNTHEAAFDESTCTFLNSSVPFSLLLTLQDSAANYPVKLKADLAQALWARAFLLGQDNSMVALTANLKKSIPSLVPLLVSYEKASTPVEKAFAAALMILRNPGMRPVITSGYGRRTALNAIDDYQDNWWQKLDLVHDKDASNGTGASATPNGDAVHYDAFLSAGQKSAGLDENQKLAKLGLAPAVLCKDVLEFAQKTPQDPRVPEALSLAVKATHFGERDSSTTKLSKECFAILHTKYPKNPWTAKTKYYY